ncbi:CRISPR-associated helicase Cas3' [Microbacterium suaedae]|uniref:CRISPR-associated helicase Cas3' n=1 Tax=Microbacterium suaedae TaxID=2067813 RepID=UPI000DA1F06E|nr:CRISPR-associated helicase Cas3' [Microbacterium suaedae]
MTTDVRNRTIDLDFNGVSERARSAWAKSWPMGVPDDQLEAWLPLHRHLADTAAVAARLWDEWLAPNTKRVIVDAIGDEEAARTLAIWLAGCHDIGKLSPAFSVQVAKLADHMDRHGLRMDCSIAGTELRSQRRHELVSHLAVEDFLKKHHGFRPDRARAIASLVAAHHGKPPSRDMIQDARREPRYIGDGNWARTREEILETITGQVTTPAVIATWRDAHLPAHALVPLSAFVVVADWIASSDAHFPLADLPSPDVDPAGRLEHAWRKLDLPTPWSADAPPDNRDLFARRFGFPDARPVQKAAMLAARECESPSLLIVEAAMGTGKTEAALAAAEILATRFGLTGVFIGLPTQATADGMFPRALDWADQLGLATPMNVFLGHGKAHLNETFDKLRMTGRLNSIGDDYGPRRARRWSDQRESSLAHAWFSHSRRGPLADLVVGTIDQSLLATLTSRHNALRHLALTGKVVVLDEIHAYDAYTNTYIEQLVRWLGAYGVPLIMLSATLPDERRQAFLDAYRDGRSQDDQAEPASTASTEYPALTVCDGQRTWVIEPGDDRPPQTIALERADDELSGLRDMLAEDLADGGCAVVIRNTVRRVQETAAYLREHLDIPIVVAHSRFLGADRARKDREMLDLFGGAEGRPEQMILVASQVVEQSLDIDFDLMVTDLAPVDLVLQRAGRLHRHDRQRPGRLRDPRLVLTGVDWTATPPTVNSGSDNIYMTYPLLRTLAALDGRAEITLPADIPRLVHEVYAEHDIHPAEWDAEVSAAKTAFLRKQDDKRDAADRFCIPSPREPRHLLGWSHASAGDPTTDAVAEASVRDGDPTLEVLVLQRVGSVLVTPTWLTEGGGQQIPENDLPSNALTRTILGSSLRLPAAVCHEPELGRHIDQLERDYPVQAWHRSHALGGELVLEFDEKRTARLGRYLLTYDRDDGLAYETTTARPQYRNEER